MSRKGIPNFKPTDEQRKLVRQLAGVGIPHESIRLLVKDANDNAVSQDTLVRHFGPELEEGKVATIAQVAGKLVATALGAPSPQATTSQIFYLKTQAGWKETAVTEHTVPDADGEGADIVDTAAKIAGLIEKGRRRMRGTDETIQ